MHFMLSCVHSNTSNDENYVLLCCVSGKKRCVPNVHKTLQVLSDLLGHENQEVSDES